MKNFTSIIDWLLRIVGFFTFFILDLIQIKNKAENMGVWEFLKSVNFSPILWGVLGLFLVWVFQYLFKKSMFLKIDDYLNTKYSDMTGLYKLWSKHEGMGLFIVRNVLLTNLTDKQTKTLVNKFYELNISIADLQEYGIDTKIIEDYTKMYHEKELEKLKQK